MTQVINKLAVILVVLAIIAASFWKIHDLRGEIRRKDTLLSKTNLEVKDERGRNTTITQQLQVKRSEVRDMQRRVRKDSTRTTQLEKEVLQLTRIVDDQGKKLRDITSVTGGTLTTHIDTSTNYRIVKYKNIYLPIIDTLRTKHYTVAFRADTLGKLHLQGDYWNRFYIVLDRSKLRRDGDVIKHPRLPWYWFKRWEHFATASSEDTSAHITSLIHVNF